MSSTCDKYLQRGVSSDKTEVHQAIKHLSKGLYPNTFCKIIDNVWESNSDKAFIIHADGAGTKSSLAYIYWKETGDISVWKNIAQDAIVMNLDDILCSAFTNQFALSSTIGRNKQRIPGEVIAAIIQGNADFCNTMKKYDVHIEYAGGETADIGDLVKTIVVDSTMATFVHKEKVVPIDIQKNDVIVGFASYGRATYESEYNSGIGSNGLTMARHELFNKQIAEKYPESYDTQLPSNVVYTGKYHVTDKINIEYSYQQKLIKESVSIGKLALSPTRTYAPLLIQILQKFHSDIHGIIHCTGGGQTKVLHFLSTPLRIIKNNLFPIPPLFKLIAEQNKDNYKELYKVFNMGHRLEIYTNESTALKMIDLAQQFGIDAHIIGRVEQGVLPEVLIQSELGEFHYTKN